MGFPIRSEKYGKTNCSEIFARTLAHVHVRNRPAARKRRPTEDDLSRVRGKDSSHVRVSRTMQENGTHLEIAIRFAPHERIQLENRVGKLDHNNINRYYQGYPQLSFFMFRCKLSNFFFFFCLKRHLLNYMVTEDWPSPIWSSTFLSFYLDTEKENLSLLTIPLGSQYRWHTRLPK